LLFLISQATGTGLGTPENQPQLSLAEARRKIVQALQAGSFDAKANRLAQMNAQRVEALKQKIATAASARRLEEKAKRDIPPQEKMKLFFEELAKMKAMGRSLTEIHTLIQSRRAGRPTAGTGSISGTVKVDGSVPPSEVMVVAFDEYGFPAGSSVASTSDGTYFIGSLSAGQYYVATQSGFVDEFYNNVLLAFFSTWRLATLVSVTDGANTPGIDFDLQIGARITGNVYEADGVTPIFFNVVNFEITSTVSPRVLFEPVGFTDANGAYEITVPALGQFKVFANVSGYAGEWYNNKASWETADGITIASLSAVIPGIDFSLAPGGGPGAAGGAIAGTVLSEIAHQPILLSFVIAFDATDTTVAGLGINGLLGPGYFIGGLPPSSYFLLAQDFLGPYIGEYYKDAPTPATATPVVVAANDTVSGIDFTLDLGGSIRGKVLGPTGAPLDSILVIAIHADIAKYFDPFLSNVEFTVASTDVNGEYTLPGLKSGDYVVRTFTPFFDLVLPVPILPLGLSKKHFGTVLDEYYENVYSIYDFDKANRIPVTAPQATTGINFNLEAPGMITGRVTNVTGTTPVTEVTILAINPATRLPEIAVSQVDSLGNYVLLPLPTGNYKLFAIVTDPESPYLSEFYDGATTLEGATPVNVTAPNPTANINFRLVLGATIQGFVYLSPGFRAGADTLWDVPVLAFEATTGMTAGVSNITFSGGYRISRLRPGSYKVAAVPFLFNYAATYVGGGATFTDPASSTILVSGGEVVDRDITLGRAGGSISGYVRDVNSGKEVGQSLVFAYDLSGHAVSAGFSSFDPINEVPLPNQGAYKIQGLRTGKYYVRTFSFFRLLTSLADFDPATLLLGSFTFDFDLYQDEWYDNVPVSPAEFDPFALLLQALAGGEFLPLPLAAMPAADATQVDVVSPNDTPNINFLLEPLVVTFPTAVDDSPGKAEVPQAYALHQNYPNPFNPATIIEYDLPQASLVHLEIYNVLGQKVATLVEQPQAAGRYRVLWDGRDETGARAVSGIYVYRLRAGDFVQARKMIFAR